MEPEVREEEERFPFRKEDLRYKHIEIKKKNESNAVVFCIMDVSGSMGENEKYIARSFFFLLYQFVLRRYNSVEVVFIAHHDSAKEVTEDEFFHRGESGGTIISSGYKKALQIIEARYHPTLWNVYAVHVSDGGNFSNDNDEALKCAKELLDRATLFGYVEIDGTDERASAILKGMYQQMGYTWGGTEYSTFLGVLKQGLEKVGKDNYALAKITNKDGVWPVLKHLLGKEKDV